MSDGKLSVRIEGAAARTFMDRVAQHYGGRLDSLVATITPTQTDGHGAPALRGGDLASVEVSINGGEVIVANGVIDSLPANPVTALEVLVSRVKAGDYNDPNEMLRKMTSLLGPAYDLIVKEANLGI